MNGLLARQIDLLSSTTRAAFVLFDLEAFTAAESTKMLGINNGALKSRVLRARRRLAQNVVQLLHAGRQQSFTRKNGSAANYSSLVGPSNGERSNDRLPATNVFGLNLPFNNFNCSTSMVFVSC
jgi:hypothetical protein